MEDRFAVLNTAREVSDLTEVVFEEYLCQLFDDLGYEAERTPGSQDGGIDLLLERDERRIVVQAGSGDGAVDADAVEEAHAARSLQRADEAWIVTTGYFTVDAQRSAEELGIRLIGGEELEELIVRAHARRPPTFTKRRSRTFANNGIFGCDSRARARAVPAVTATARTGVRGSRAKLRRIGAWERIRRAVDYSFLLPDCWLNGLEHSERSRRLLLAVAAILMASPKGSLTAEAVRCQLPPTLDGAELVYVLRSVPLFKTMPPQGGEERFVLDHELITSCYDMTYGKIDAAIAALIEAIEALPEGALSVVEGVKMVPAGFAYADRLDDETLARAVTLQYVVAYPYPDRTVYVPSQLKELLFQNAFEARYVPSVEEVRRQTYMAFAEAEQDHIARPAWELAQRYHERITELYERFCTVDQGALGLCYQALYESGGGLTALEVAEYAATMQGVPCAPESVDHLRANCLETDSLIAKMDGMGDEGDPPRYFLVFQLGIDGEFLWDHVATDRMLQAQIDALLANMSMPPALNGALDALYRQHAYFTGALEVRAYRDRKQKQWMRESLTALEAQIAAAQAAEAAAQQQAYAMLSAELERKSWEQQALAPACEADKWRFPSS